MLVNKYWAAKLEDKRVVVLLPKGISSDMCKVNIKHNRNKRTLLILNRITPSKFRIGDVIGNHYSLHVITDVDDYTYSLTRLTTRYSIISCSCCYINKTEEFKWHVIPYTNKKLQQVLNLD